MIFEVKIKFLVPAMFFTVFPAKISHCLLKQVFSLKIYKNQGQKNLGLTFFKTAAYVDSKLCPLLLVFAEIVELTFDEKTTSYEDLLSWFWNHHDPIQPRKKQYRSAILYVDEQQKEAAEKSLEKEQVRISY